MHRPEGVAQESMLGEQQSAQSTAQRRELQGGEQEGWSVTDYRTPVNAARVESGRYGSE